MKPLTTYSNKRNFKKTAEPTAKITKVKSKKKLMFMVHEHHASHLHYDFRLELDGVLKCWAVPKGPSPNPKQKRLAVQVEDHPFAYGKFHGRIPEGEYGAGEVLIWDRGTWIPESEPHVALKKGHLNFSLSGTRMKGDWSLIRTKLQGSKPNWLLVKREDEYAKTFQADSLLNASDLVYHAIKPYGSKRETSKKKD